MIDKRFYGGLGSVIALVVLVVLVKGDHRPHQSSRHDVYLAKCQPLRDQYAQLSDDFGLNARKRELDDVYVAYRTCMAGESNDAIIAGEISIPGR
jgi:hypothetical protein